MNLPQAQTMNISNAKPICLFWTHLSLALIKQVVKCAMNYIVRWLKQSRAICLNAFNPSKYSFQMRLVNMYYMHIYEWMTQEPLRSFPPPLGLLQTSSVWQLTKAQSQNIIKYKLNLLWLEIKHVHRPFKVGSFKSRLKCPAGLGPATSFSRWDPALWCHLFCKSRRFYCRPRGPTGDG